MVIPWRWYLLPRRAKPGARPSKTLGVPSISVLSRDPHLSSKPPETQEKELSFLKITMVEKNSESAPGQTRAPNISPKITRQHPKWARILMFDTTAPKKMFSKGPPWERNAKLRSGVHQFGAEAKKSFPPPPRPGACLAVWFSLACFRPRFFVSLLVKNTSRSQN